MSMKPTSYRMVPVVLVAIAIMVAVDLVEDRYDCIPPPGNDCLVESGAKLFELPNPCPTAAP